MPLSSAPTIAQESNFVSTSIFQPRSCSSDAEYKRVQSAFGGLGIYGVSFRVMRGNLTSNDYLRRAGVTEADSVILGAINSSTGWDAADVDAQVC